MTLAEDVEDFIKLLNLHEIEYMVVGGMPWHFTVSHAILAILIYGLMYLKKIILETSII